jgi:SAM-dependent methyltransferase
MADQKRENRYSCELGDIAYWDAVYKTELEQISDNPEVLEDWFERWTRPGLGQWLRRRAGSKLERLRFLDVGCGNGEFLRHLAHQHGFRCLYGFDASEFAIEVAKQSVAHIWDAEIRGSVELDLQVSDVLAYSPPSVDGHVDIVHDKGTLDAILLSGDREKLHEYLHRCLFVWLDPTQALGMLVITSCNYTRVELESLVEHVAAKGLHRDASESPHRICALKSEEDVPRYPELRFGGSYGSAIITSAWSWRTVEQPEVISGGDERLP